MWDCKNCNTSNEDTDIKCKGCEAAREEALPAAKEKRLKKRHIVIGAVIAALIAAAVGLLIFRSVGMPGANSVEDTLSYDGLVNSADTIDGSENILEMVVDGTDVKVSKDIWDYYFESAVKNYANKVNQNIEDIDWDDETIQTVKYDALLSLVKDEAVISQAEKWGIALDQNDTERIDIDLDYYKQAYGDNVYKELGMKDEKTFRTVCANSLLEQKILSRVKEDISAYVSDVSDLENYATNKSASVEIIEFTKGEDGKSEAESAKANIAAAKERLDNGEDFEQVWLDTMGEQYTQNIGVTYTKPLVQILYDGTISEAFKSIGDAAFSLKIGEISQVVETDYSYAIIKRVAGYTELENMLISEADIAINKGMLNSAEVPDIK